MDDQKIENLLNLSLDATQQEREKSESLETGYDEQNRTWEVIVRYSGDLRTEVRPDWKIVFLSGGYAIVTLPTEDVNVLAALPQIEYVEKPKRMYFQTDAGRRASCISALQTPEVELFGSGVLTAVIDSGVDYFHPDFRNDDGTSRILAMWDQTGVLPEEEGELFQKENAADDMENVETEGEKLLENVENRSDEEQSSGKGIVGKIPAGFVSGVEYTKEEINRALAAADAVGGPGGRAAGLAVVPEQDLVGHGTEVLGIVAGNGRVSGGQYRGVAPLSDIIVVKLGMPREQGFPRTTELMQAIEYVYRKAEEFRMPMAVNISFGNVYGSHRGTSLLETYIDMMASRGRSVIAVGTGNEGNAGGHISGNFGSAVRNVGGKDTGQLQEIDGRAVSGIPGRRGNLGLSGKILQPVEIELLVGDFETSLNLQIWKNYADEFRISLIAPDGRTAGPFGQEIGASRYRLSNTDLLVYYGKPSPYQSSQEIYVDFIPYGTYIDSGIWKIVLTPQRIVNGAYELWLNDARARNSITRFQRSSPDVTMTIPSSASQVIAVGAYDARQNTYASFSGRGWPDMVYGVRPDLVAPGVEITTTAAGGGYVSVTGTSFATPFVTGSAVLMMEWGEGGIIRLCQKGEEISGYLGWGVPDVLDREFLKSQIRTS